MDKLTYTVIIFNKIKSGRSGGGEERNKIVINNKIKLY